MASTPSQSSQCPQSILLEFLDPAAGHESEFDTWWPVHARQMIANAGLSSAQLHLRSSAKLKRTGSVPLPVHLAIYSFCTADIPSVSATLNRSIADLAPLADPQSARIFVYQQTGKWTSVAAEPQGPRYRQLVFGNALTGREEDFNHWYDGTHAADLVTVPGVTGVIRYRFDRILLGQGEVPQKYISMMDFKTQSVDQFSELLDAMGARFVNSDSFDAAHAWRLLLEFNGQHEAITGESQ